MILCDIGNSYFHFYEEGRIRKIPVEGSIRDYEEKRVFYINVNERLRRKLFGLKEWIDLEPHATLESAYQGLGIDRKMACIAVRDGVVVDAGSAITVDVMQDSIHLGGFILPGLAAYDQAYQSISVRLAARLRTAVALDALPQNTVDAISYGTLKSIVLLLRDTMRSKRIIFTGGDGKFFARFFENSVYDATLVFKGMQRTIEKNGYLI